MYLFLYLNYLYCYYIAGTDLAIIGLGQPEDKADKFIKPEPKSQFCKDLQPEELLLSSKDEDYINSLIMSEEESRHKTRLWHQINAGYLKDQKSKYWIIFLI